MISVEDALAKFETAFSRLGSEQIPVSECLGRVLAEDVTAAVTQPPSDVSSMDGYAVRASDAKNQPFSLTLIGESAAGHGFSGTMAAGQTVRIFTGAPIPDGADAVIMQEDTEATGQTITFNEVARPGKFVRKAGLDFNAGEVLLPAGRVLTARDIGLAAAMNRPWLPVARRPRVAVLATGDELVMPGEAIGPDQIISSNSVAVMAYVQALGGVGLNLGIAKDTAESLAERLEAAKGADLLVTIGGASVGDHDIVRQALGRDDVDLSFYRVAMRPGKPVIFGHVGGIPLLGMPGNPVSAGVSSVIYLRLAIWRMLGVSDARMAETRVTLGSDLPENDKRRDYLRAEISRDADGQMVATPFGAQDSAMMAMFARADALVIRPPLAPAAKAGDQVPAILLRGGGLIDL